MPAWAVLVTYLLCWGLGGYMAVTAMGDTATLVAAVFFVVWPITGTSPVELVKAWRGSG